jgi:hypothetical protein
VEIVKSEGYFSSIELCDGIGKALQDQKSAQCNARWCQNLLAIGVTNLRFS